MSFLALGLAGRKLELPLQNHYPLLSEIVPDVLSFLMIGKYETHPAAG
jgi:hypothetical protein